MVLQDKGSIFSQLVCQEIGSWRIDSGSALYPRCRRYLLDHKTRIIRFSSFQAIAELQTCRLPGQDIRNRLARWSDITRDKNGMVLYVRY